MMVTPVAPVGALRFAWLRTPTSCPTDSNRPSDHVKISTANVRLDQIAERQAADLLQLSSGGRNTAI
jgi:hypothetical protein